MKEGGLSAWLATFDIEKTGFWDVGWKCIILPVVVRNRARVGGVGVMMKE